MRKLIAVALIGASAALFSATAPAQAMTAGSGIASKSAVPAAGNVEEVGRRWKHRHYHRHRHWHHRRHWRHRHWGYGPRYYGYYGGYYPYRYYRRPGVRLYFGY